MMPSSLRLSILGDSISTYRGISNDASACRSTAGNPCYYRAPFPIRDTYWMRLIDALGLTLCVNNSWSGGNLSGKNDDFSGVRRASALSRDNGEHPDLIIVFMGINDLGRNVAPTVFSSDYNEALLTIKKQYPTARVCCINLPDRDIIPSSRTECFNHVIEDAAKAAGERFFVADLYHSRLCRETYYLNTMDGLHPDPDGMRMIAEVAESAIREHCKDLPLREINT